ncbi:MAG TPA: sigma-70 family RNA polymerase sigma factor [Planctomycetes bacterium]|nr:sigma-70 family RNA polymerase sigma factor [Planctomycetota bacterium]
MAKIGQRARSSSQGESWLALVLSRGDERLALWGELFSELQPRLAVFIHYRMTPALRRRWPVEDVIQVTFLKAWKRIDSFHDGANDGPYRWLVTIAYNVLCEVKRSESVRRIEKRSTELKGAEDSTSGGVSALALAESAERASRMAMHNEETTRVLECLESLVEGDRDVIVLRVFEDLTFGEVGARLEITESAARKRFHRAMERLKSLHGDIEGLLA